MAPETSTQTDTRAAETVSPVTSGTTTPHRSYAEPVQEHFAPAMPSRAMPADHRGAATADGVPPHPSQQQQQQPYVLYPSSYGNHYIPYEARQSELLGQANMNAQQHGGHVVPPRIIVQESKPWRTTKDVMHVLVMATSIAGIGIGISLAHESYYSDAIIGTLVAVPIFGVALIWSLAEMITRATTHWGPGIHPGAHVGVCLILWLAAVLGGGCLATYVSFVTYEDCEYRSSRYSSNSSECESRPTRGRFLGLAILAFALFIWEFFLFVAGCIDTHRRNKARSNAPIMIVAQPGMHPQPAMVQQPMAQQQYYYPPPPQAYHPHQSGAGPHPMHPSAAADARAAAPEGQRESTRGKQPETAQHPNITEFYSPAGPGTAV
ncbi:hypothetical protein O9K51_00055 [Purpureocillium lavendulum]|uniref:MARVEL domain-containing protein n=1 Tax=Purpureocillium lavendulum TaxID=1247861 RepID=A0AB34G382_9HYPO|nr:hypothetical protein O9K51_00055 [Purpureocillium lavendulum]